MRVPWKLLGLAGLAGVAGTGVLIARRRRAQRHYDPEELRARLHRRLAEVTGEDGADAGAGGDERTAAGGARRRGGSGAAGGGA